MGVKIYINFVIAIVICVPIRVRTHAHATWRNCLLWKVLMLLNNWWANGAGSFSFHFLFSFLFRSHFTTSFRHVQIDFFIQIVLFGMNGGNVWMRERVWMCAALRRPYKSHTNTHRATRSMACKQKEIYFLFCDAKINFSSLPRRRQRRRREGGGWWRPHAWTSVLTLSLPQTSTKFKRTGDKMTGSRHTTWTLYLAPHFVLAIIAIVAIIIVVVIVITTHIIDEPRTWS